MKDQTNQVKLPFFCPYWGFEHILLEHFLPKVKNAGYAGIEINIVFYTKKEVISLFELAAIHQLLIITQVAGIVETDFKIHKERFIENLDFQISLNPFLINCHTGADYFSFEQNMELILLTEEKRRKSGVDIVHETHRGRFNYSPGETNKYLLKNSDFQLTADFSHWCVVSESLLENHAVSVSHAILRSRHIHSRVGHAQAPQVNDPRLSEWENALNAHLAWWDAIVANSLKSNSTLSITTEFGPPNYMPTVPFTRLPIASQWDINLYMKELLTNRYLK